MKPIGILRWVNTVKERVLRQVLREGKLKKDPINVRVLIELVNHCFNLLSTGGSRQAAVQGYEATVSRDFLFVANISLRGRVIPDQNNAEARSSAVRLRKLRHTKLDLLLKSLRKPFSVKNSWFHGCYLYAGALGFQGIRGD